MKVNRQQVVEAAARIADGRGLTELTMAALASDLGIAMPSLYGHVKNLAHLRQELALSVSMDLAAVMGEAIQGYAGPDALSALAGAYRTFAVQHAGRYAAGMLVAPDLTDPRHREAARKCASTVYGALRGYGLEEPELTDAARFVRSALHGFVSLEGQGGFAHERDVNLSFRAFVAAADRTLRSWPRQNPGPAPQDQYDDLD